MIAERARLDLADPMPESWELRRGWHGPRAYARSKLLLAGRDLRLGAAPGGTAWWRTWSIPARSRPASCATACSPRWPGASCGPSCSRPPQGAEAPLHLAARARLGGSLGTLRASDGPRRPLAPLALDDALIDRVWQLTEEIVTR